MVGVTSPHRPALESYAWLLGERSCWSKHPPLVAIAAALQLSRMLRQHVAIAQLVFTTSPS
jgi:hypothetical protein